MRNLGARQSGLHKHELETLIRIKKQMVKKHGAQHETVKHLMDIRRKQQMQDYEMEYDRLRSAGPRDGPLHRAAAKRLGELQTMFQELKSGE